MPRSILVLFLSVILAAAALLPACAKAGSALNGSGKIVDQDVNIADFTAVNAQGAFQVKIRQAEQFHVVLSTDDNLLNRVVIVLDHNTLKLNIEAPSTFFPTSLAITIDMPQLAGLNLSGGASATISGFTSLQPFSLILTDKGTLDGDIEAGSLNFSLTGGSTAVLRGSATDIVLVANAGSQVDLSNLILSKAKVNLDQKTDAIVNVSGQIDVTLNHESNLFFLGNPIFTNTSVANGSSMSMVKK